MMKNQKGFIQIIIILIVLALIGGAYYFGTKNKQNVVSEFPTSTPVSFTKPTTDPTASWKTYINTKYQFKYPNNWSFLSSLNNTNLMVAPIEKIEEVKSLSARGDGFGGGPLSTFEITEVDQSSGYVLKSDDYQKVTSSEVEIDGKKSVKYSALMLQSNPFGEPGDRMDRILVPFDQKYLVFTLWNDSYEKTFDQILSTFKFTN